MHEIAYHRISPLERFRRQRDSDRQATRYRERQMMKLRCTTQELGSLIERGDPIDAAFLEERDADQEAAFVVSDPALEG